MTSLQLQKHIWTTKYLRKLGSHGNWIQSTGQDGSRRRWLYNILDSLHVYERDDLKTDIQAIGIDVTVISQKLLLGCVYIPPDCYNLYNKFHSLLEHSVRNRKNVVILGDLNSDLIAKGYEGRRLLRIFGSFDLHNVVKDPTRTTVTTSTLLDLLITTDTSKIITSGTIDPGLFDRCLIYGIVKLQRKRTPPKYICAKNYKQVNIEKLKYAFNTARWSAIEAFDDSDDITWVWETLVARITHKKKLNDFGPIADDPGNMILDDKNKAEAMNDYFVAVGPNLASQVNPIPYFRDIEHIYRITPTLPGVNLNKARSL